MYAYVDGESPISAGVYFFYVLAQDLRQVRVPVLGGLTENLHDVLRVDGSTARLPPADDVLQLSLADSEAVHLLVQFGEIIKAVQDCPQAVVKLGVDAGKLRAFGGQLRGGVVDMVGDPLRLSLEFRVGQICAHGLDDLALQPVGVDALTVAGVRAVAVAAYIGAGLDTLLVCRGVPDVCPAAFLTLDQAGQQIRPLRFIGGVSLVIAHSFLHPFPCRFVDERRKRVLNADTIWIRPAARPAPEVLRVPLIPCVDADIPLVRQDRMQAVLSERAAILPRGAFHGVQDRVVALPFPVQAEDRFDRLRLCRIDDIALIDNIIAEGRHAAEKHALLRLDRHAGDGLLTRLQHLVLPHADVQQLHEEVAALRDVAKLLCRRDDLDPERHHLFAEVEPVRHVAAAAGDIIDHDGVKFPAFRRGKHPLEVLAVGIGAGLRAVYVGRRDRDMVLGAILSDGVELVLYAVFSLIARAVAGILRSFHLHSLQCCVILKGQKEDPQSILPYAALGVPAPGAALFYITLFGTEDTAPIYTKVTRKSKANSMRHMRTGDAPLSSRTLSNDSPRYCSPAANRQQQNKTNRSRKGRLNNSSPPMS